VTLLLSAATGLAQNTGVPPQIPKDTFDGVKRIVAFGDIHGDYDRLVELLRTAQLVDNKNKWIGNKSHLVLCGDDVDRGTSTAKVLDLLMALEPQALKAGGEIHTLIGNHEAMNLYGDLRYVTKEDFAGFALPNAKELREQYLHNVLEDLKKKGT